MARGQLIHQAAASGHRVLVPARRDYKNTSCPAGRARSVRRHTRRLGHASSGRKLQPRRPPRAPPAPPWTGQAPRRLCQPLPSQMQVSSALGLLWVFDPPPSERCPGRNDRCLAAQGLCERAMVADVGLCHAQNTVSSCCLPADAGSHVGFLELHCPAQGRPILCQSVQAGTAPRWDAEAGINEHLLRLWWWRHPSQQCCARQARLCPAP